MTEENQPLADRGGKSRPGGLLMVGAAVIVGNWVVLGLLAGEWNPGAIYIALALLVLLSVFGVGGIVVGAGTQRGIGLFMGLAALVILLADLRFDGFPEGFARVIAYVVFIGGAGLMFVGARRLEG